MPNFSILEDFEKLKKFESLGVRFKTLSSIKHDGRDYTIPSISIGAEDKTLPTFGLFGGVHGLERIGCQVIISFFNTLLEQASWDKNLRESLKTFRIVSIPIVNPVGVAHFTRSNGNNVDLMRNAPIDAEGAVYPLASGHRVSPLLPWYRGELGVIEKESETLIQFVEDEMFQSNVSIALDVHSGFGMKDQIWYPYAGSTKKFPREDEALKLKELLDRTYPNHIYKYEAQSVNYLNHGDLWDYIFGLHEEKAKGFFLPLTLELGSWSWVKKNPSQLFSKLGLYHPMKEHRQARTMRRHILLLDFLIKALRNTEAWVKTDLNR